MEEKLSSELIEKIDEILERADIPERHTYFQIEKFTCVVGYYHKCIKQVLFYFFRLYKNDCQRSSAFPWRNIS